MDELIEKYNASSPEMKEFYHKKYGKKRIQRIIEEADISKYLKENCKNCPSCRVQIEVYFVLKWYSKTLSSVLIWKLLINDIF